MSFCNLSASNDVVINGLIKNHKLTTKKNTATIIDTGIKKLLELTELL
jgi:hypothetical protein